MNIVLVVAVVFVVGIILFFRLAGRRNPANYIVPGNLAGLLLQHVAFYQALDEEGRQRFEDRVTDFLNNVAIRGIEVTVEDIDRALVAAGAIIPIFNFPGWRYNNISEVLVYKGTFNKQFETDGKDRNVLGMVGDGAMHRVMILSQPSLRSSFARATDGHNTVIHEFVHLIDKADGSVDGIPEVLLSKPYTIPWFREMHQQMAGIRRKGVRSDIDTYAATGDAEFFAVVAEYFFERPAELEKRHPQLFELLTLMFAPQPRTGKTRR